MESDNFPPEKINICREHRHAVKDLLHQRNNTILIVIHPASKAAKKRHDTYPYSVPTMTVSPCLVVHVHATQFGMSGNRSFFGLSCEHCSRITTQVGHVRTIGQTIM